MRSLVETNVKGIRAVLFSSSDIDVATASQQELREHGLPLRPNPDSSPEAYRRWIHFWSRPFQRIVPEFEQISRTGGPARIVTGPQKIGNQTMANSSNWSGTVIIDATNPFKHSSNEIAGEWTVPTPSCSGANSGSYSSSCWVGIDGWGSNEVFQCGTASDITCGPGGGASVYFWFEWFPSYSVKVTNLGVKPGDEVLVSSYITPGPGGKHYIVVINKSYGWFGFHTEIDPPPGVALVGNSVEWIVERPTINGVISQLSHIGEIAIGGREYFTNDAGQTFESYPGSAANGTLIQVSMIDNQGRVLSTPSISGVGSSSVLRCKTYP